MLRTEADVVRSLEGTYSIEALYQAVVAAGLESRDGGADVIHGRSDQRYKRRVRCALQTMKRSGRATRVGDGTWFVTGTRQQPRWAIYVVLDRQAGDFELVLGNAVDLLRSLDEPADLIIADPPWGLGRQKANNPLRDRGERVYARNSSQVVGGYVDVDPDAYTVFTREWVAAAAGALRAKGGYLAAISGPQQSARIQVAGEEAGLTYVNQLVYKRPFSLRTTRRFSHAHHVVTVLCAGPLESPHRFFASPPCLPKAKSGVDYPLSWWPDIPKYERRGLLRYDNAQHPNVVRRLVHALTPGEWEALVADPFLGSGTTALVCLEEQRRFVGGDVNPESLRFTMARLREERAIA